MKLIGQIKCKYYNDTCKERGCKYGVIINKNRPGRHKEICGSYDPEEKGKRLEIVVGELK